ncbi:MAG: hypothetical protein LBK52_00455 [Deltaproteobacteria bacterium]|jgi:hypothetical protein|nr:hypothetical protein [Deltaproteobacteria bacterium]
MIESFPESAESADRCRQALISLALEAWRFGQIFLDLLAKTEAGADRRYLSRYQWFKKKVGQSLEEAGLELVNLEGHAYDPGLAVLAVNLEDFQPADRLEIERMLEPVITGPKGLVRAGTVTVKKVLA